MFKRFWAQYDSPWEWELVNLFLTVKSQNKYLIYCCISSQTRAGFCNIKCQVRDGLSMKFKYVKLILCLNMRVKMSLKWYMPWVFRETELFFSEYSRPWSFANTCIFATDKNIQKFKLCLLCIKWASELLYHTTLTWWLQSLSFVIMES